MRVLTLIFPCLISLVLGGLVVLVPMYASADCCGCGYCFMKYYTDPPCDCPGDNGCATCLTDEPNPLLSKTVIAMGMADISPNLGVPTYAVAKLEVAERVMDLMSGGKCFRAKVALSLLGTIRDGLKLKPVRFDEKNAKNRTVTF